MPNHFNESHVNIDTQTEFETRGIRIRADIRAAVGVVVPREMLEDAGDEISATAVIEQYRRALVAKLLQDPPAWMIRPGEYVNYLQHDELIPRK